MKNMKLNEILEINIGKVDLPFQIFFKTVNKILNKHLFLRKLYIQEKRTMLVSLKIRIVNTGNAQELKMQHEKIQGVPQ